VNNTCPSCGAIYNVAQKDIGRRIKCKKCSSALVVTEAGLEVDEGGPVPAGAADDIFEEEDATRSRKKKRRSEDGGGGVDAVQVFRDYGGVPTLLFAFGAFLVIVFLFSPLIGHAAVDRARGAEARAQLELDQRIQKAERDKSTPEEISKMREEYAKKKAPELQDNIASARISVLRDVYFDRYGMMFGFLFLMLGSLGFMGPGQATIRRIVGAIVLCAQVIIIFLVFAQMSGCGGGSSTGGGSIFPKGGSRNIE
jgi:hypothetical protein